MNYLLSFFTPQLEKIHQGKVRDSIRVDEQTRMIVVTDRLSAFDSVLETPIPHKGAVLNGIANWWFENTGDIIDNHFLKQIDPNMTLVSEARPIRIEMIVRGYLTGSMWRGYVKGQRTFSGVTVGNGFTKNQAFAKPIVTPTTKEKHDRPISPEDILKEGWTDKETYDKMEAISLQLFERGSKHLAEKGIILVDTKYEFGLLDGELILIDEIHTPDSSRFWSAEDYNNKPETATQIDKEYVRQWLIANKEEGKYPTKLTDEVAQEASRRYRQIYETITGQAFDTGNGEHIKDRMSRNLVNEGLIKDAYVAMIMGSPSDLEHCKKIESYLTDYNVATECRVVSAHKNGENIPAIANIINNAVEPCAVIAVAGRSNGLGGALAANLNVPVINCPPFSDKTDLMLNINSSLIMPSKTPAATVVHQDNAAYAALRSLNIPRLKERFNQDIAKLKMGLIEADAKIRN